MAEDAQLLHNRRPRPRQFARMAELERRTANSARRATVPRPSAPAPLRLPAAAAAEEGRARLSETLEPALPDHLDEQAERLMHRVCDRRADGRHGRKLHRRDARGAADRHRRRGPRLRPRLRHLHQGLEGRAARHRAGLLERNDAVSEVVARAMAEGALKRSRPISPWGSPALPGRRGPERKRASSTWRSRGAAAAPCTARSISARSAVATSG